MDISFSEAKSMFGTAVDLIKKGAQVEAQAQIQKLQEQYLELHAKNLELKQELLEAQTKLREQEDLVFEDPFFFLVRGEDKDGPFCPRCWQGDGRKCRIVATPDSYGGSHQCQVCDSCYGKGKTIERSDHSGWYE